MGLTFPWLVVGDFNQVLWQHEKKGGNRLNPNCLSPMRRMVDSCGLIDMGYVGAPFTWSNMRSGVANIQERLDRALCNQAWQTLFPETVVTHLPRVKSDHCPLLLQVIRRLARRWEYPFRVLAAWYHHDQFHELVQAGWGGSEDETVRVKMQRFSGLASIWNKEVSGNIFWRKKNLLARLAGIQRRVSVRPSRYLPTLASQLRMDLDKVLIQEESLWRQKSRISWLKGGEQNTKFFHTSTMIRRRQSRILCLKDAHGDWQEDAVVLQEMASQFYQNLYTAEPTPVLQTSRWNFPPLERADTSWMNRCVSDTEVRRALFQMGADKTPGLDGFPPRFLSTLLAHCGRIHSFLCAKSLSCGTSTTGYESGSYLLDSEGCGAEGASSISAYFPLQCACEVGL